MVQKTEFYAARCGGGLLDDEREEENQFILQVFQEVSRQLDLPMSDDIGEMRAIID